MKPPVFQIRSILSGQSLTLSLSIRKLNNTKCQARFSDIISKRYSLVRSKWTILGQSGRSAPFDRSFFPTDPLAFLSSENLGSETGWFAGRGLAISQVETKYFIWMDDDLKVTEKTDLEKLLEIIEDLNFDLIGAMFDNSWFQIIFYFEWMYLSYRSFWNLWKGPCKREIWPKKSFQNRPSSRWFLLQSAK